MYFDKAQTGNRQVLDVCVRLEDGDPPTRITRMETSGDDFSIEGVTDYDGNIIPRPVANHVMNEYHIQVRIAYEPISDRSDDGALVVRFRDGQGLERTLLVPILVR
jgi:hypothetical protein